MNVIWKFPLINEETDIEACIVSFLTVQTQDGIPCVWAIVNPNGIPKKYKVTTIGTGWECEKIDVTKYIGTIQEGLYVWHYFWEEVEIYKETNEPVFAFFSKL